MRILFLWLMGCGGSEVEPCDTNVFICDTAAYWERQKLNDVTWDNSDGTYIDVVRIPACEEERWVVSARTKGWTAGPKNLVNLWTRTQNSGATDEIPGWNEEHPLAVIGSDPSGGWDELEARLQTGFSVGEVVAGSRTALICGLHDVEPLMTYVLRVYDPSGNLADCAVFSTESNADRAIEDVLAGQRDEVHPITDPQQISAANCLIWK